MQEGCTELCKSTFYKLCRQTTVPIQFIGVHRYSGDIPPPWCPQTNPPWQLNLCKSPLPPRLNFYNPEKNYTIFTKKTLPFPSTLDKNCVKSNPGNQPLPPLHPYGLHTCIFERKTCKSSIFWCPGCCWSESETRMRSCRIRTSLRRSCRSCTNRTFPFSCRSRRGWLG